MNLANVVQVDDPRRRSSHLRQGKWPCHNEQTTRLRIGGAFFGRATIENPNWNGERRAIVFLAVLAKFQLNHNKNERVASPLSE